MPRTLRNSTKLFLPQVSQLAQKWGFLCFKLTYQLIDIQIFMIN